MPLIGDLAKDFAELYRDNRRKGKEKGANGKKRSREQIIAIALSVHKKKNK